MIILNREKNPDDADNRNGGSDISCTGHLRF